MKEVLELNDLTSGDVLADTAGNDVLVVTAVGTQSILGFVRQTIKEDGSIIFSNVEEKFVPNILYSLKKRTNTDILVNKETTEEVSS